MDIALRNIPHPPGGPVSLRAGYLQIYRIGSRWISPTGTTVAIPARQHPFAKAPGQNETGPPGAIGPPYITTAFPNFRRITAICPECIISWLAIVRNAEATLSAYPRINSGAG